MRDHSDSRLVASARGGSRAAAAELVRRHWRVAWARGYAVTGRAALAEDVAQDAMAAALAKLDTLHEPSGFAPWLARIATHRALDALRAERRLTALDAAPEPAVEWVDDAGDGAEVRRAVASLPIERRTVVVMRFWLDCAPSEIAETLGIPVGTVNSRIARAQEQLRQILGESSRA
ncbi:MAG: RNA polymerase sigma factor [Thermoleophilia bacterium]